MNKLTIGSIVTATLLLVGCGSTGSTDSSTASSLSDSSTPTNTPTNNGVQPIVKGYYVDSAVEGIHYQCGNESGTTDENGTFTFKMGNDCNFTLGGVKLRDINLSLLENNITVFETNLTVAQLLQTLDSDGNASNGIQIPKGADAIIKETLPSLEGLNKDLLEAIHDRLKAEHSNEYNGTVIAENQTREHLNETKADLAKRNIRTTLDVEAENSSDQSGNNQGQDNSSNSSDQSGNNQGQDNSSDSSDQSGNNQGQDNSSNSSDQSGNNQGQDNSSDSSDQSGNNQGKQ